MKVVCIIVQLKSSEYLNSVLTEHTFVKNVNRTDDSVLFTQPCDSHSVLSKRVYVTQPCDSLMLYDFT